MPDISITVTDKRPVCTAGTTVVCDNSDYIVHWDLDEEWSAYDSKTMRVIYMDSTYADTVFSGDSVALPPVPVPGCVQIGLYAGDIHTSRMALLRALSSVRSASGAPANPTPDVYDQLMELIKGMGGVEPDDIAKAVADYLAAHPIEETDPTVPEWAKAETKPTYSAAEVGAISRSDLQAATDAALAQAKASGEFDGPAGPQGPAGAGMDVTGATVGQIAKIAAVDASGVPTAWEPVDMASGGKAWAKIIDAEITEATMLFEATGLDNVTELYCEWVGLKTASETGKRELDLYINDMLVCASWVDNNASNGLYRLGYSLSKYNGLVWYNVKSAGIVGNENTFNTSMGAYGRVSYMLARDVGAAKKIKISAVNADNRPVTGQIRVWAR